MRIIVRLIICHAKACARVMIWICAFYVHYFLPLPRAHTRIQIFQYDGRLSCTARLSSSKTNVVSTRREYSRTTHRINKIYSWTTHVRLSYFKAPPFHPIRSPSSVCAAPAATSAIISALRRADFKGSPCKNLYPSSPSSPSAKKTAVNVCSLRIFR